MFILSIFSTYIVESTGMNKEILIVDTQTICNRLWASKYNINCNDSTINNCVCLSIHKKWQPVNVFRPMFIWNQQRQVTNDIDGFSNAFGRNVTATFFETLPLMARFKTQNHAFSYSWRLQRRMRMKSIHFSRICAICGVFTQM